MENSSMTQATASSDAGLDDEASSDEEIDVAARQLVASILDRATRRPIAPVRPLTLRQELVTLVTALPWDVDKAWEASSPVLPARLEVTAGSGFRVFLVIRGRGLVEFHEVDRPRAPSRWKRLLKKDASTTSTVSGILETADFALGEAVSDRVQLTMWLRGRSTPALVEFGDVQTLALAATSLWLSMAGRPDTWWRTMGEMVHV